MPAGNTMPCPIFLLIGMFVLTIILIALFISRKELPGQKTRLNTGLSIIVVILLISCIVGFFVIRSQPYGYKSLYHLDIQIADSSEGFTIGDFKFESGGSQSRYQEKNKIYLWDLKPRTMEHITILCNETGIFWGNQSFEFSINASFSSYNSVSNIRIYYHNMTNEDQIIEINTPDYWIRTPVFFNFTNADKWIDFEMSIGSPPIVD